MAEESSPNSKLKGHRKYRVETKWRERERQRGKVPGKRRDIYFIRFWNEVSWKERELGRSGAPASLCLFVLSTHVCMLFIDM